MASGSQAGYAIAQDGDLRRMDRVMLAHARSFRVVQRATVPNLPGRWVLAETGPLAGMWLRESTSAHLDGFVERTGYSGGVQLRLRSAIHLGRRFTADGGVRATRSLERDRDDVGHGRRQGDHQRSALLAYRRRPAWTATGWPSPPRPSCPGRSTAWACPAARQSTSARGPIPATATARRAA